MRSEALECVQLAAAFSGGSLLPAWFIGRPAQGPLRPGRPWNKSRARAGAERPPEKSGSKLHALQSSATFRQEGCR